MKIKALVQILILFFPWSIRRRILNSLFNYNIHKSASIGKSFIFSDKLIMKEHSKIGHFTFCNNIDGLELGEYARIGTFNYITGLTIKNRKFFMHRTDRKCLLEIGKHSAITSRHFIDCTDRVKVGEFTTIAGIRSQIFTHSINIKENIQDCKAIEIGSYCFMGTNSTILPGSKLPDYSVLGAGSVLNKSYEEEFTLYGGVPAAVIKNMSKDDTEYFNRTTGFVS